MLKPRLYFIAALFLTACAVAEAVTIGPAMTKKERQRLERASGGPAVSYEAVLENFLNGDFAESERLAAKGTGPDRAEETSYLRALSLMKLGRFSEARPLLAELESRSSSPEMRAQAAYSLGDSYYFENNRAEADARYKEAVSKYPFHGEAEQVKRLLGLSHPPRQAAPLQQFGIEETALSSLQYSVQVGAFGRRRNAERLLNRLLRNRYDAFISRDGQEERFRVRVGRLPGAEEASALETRLKKDGYPTKIVS